MVGRRGTGRTTHAHRLPSQQCNISYPAKAMGRSVLASGELGKHNGLRWTIIVSTDLSAGDSQAGSDTAPRVGVRRRWPLLSHRPSARHPRSRRSHRQLPHRCNPKHPISTRLRHHLTAQPTPTQRPMPMQLIQHAVDDRHAHGLAAALAIAGRLRTRSLRPHQRHARRLV